MHARRFTWGVIQGRRAAHGTAVLLTSHSMEEADLLADSIAIMAHGRWAGVGVCGVCACGRGVCMCVSVWVWVGGGGGGICSA
jgi:ABC-type thiamine transport system ATPase subunit